MVYVLAALVRVTVEILRLTSLWVLVVAGGPVGPFHVLR